MASAVTEQATPKTDPELLRQISAAEQKNDPVMGIFRIRPEDSTKLTNSPERTKEIINEVVERVSKKVRGKAHRLNVLGNLGVMVISAPSQFMTELLKQPEIFSAMANESSESGKIDPINKRQVRESAINRRVNITHDGYAMPGAKRGKTSTASQKRPSARKTAAAKKR